MLIVSSRACQRLLLVLGWALVMCFATLPANSETTGAVMATGLRVSTAGQVTQIQIDLSAKLLFQAVASDSKNGVTIVAKGLEFAIPTGAGKKPKGLVSRIRYGKSADGQAEIAIDTTKPVKLRSSYLAMEKRSKHFRITILLEPKLETAETSVAMPDASPEITGSLPTPSSVTIDPSNGRKPVIVIDPGHGGIDPGAISASGTKEKEVVLGFAQALQAALLAKGEYEIVLTRDRDTFLPLDARVEVARQKQADLFIAVHADTVGAHSVHGTTLYLLSDQASDAEAEALAQKENKADSIAGMNLESQSSSVVDVLVSLAQRESKNRAAMFAETAVDKLRPDTTFTGKPLRSAGFVVLKAAEVPSVLVELGYLSNAQDEKNMTNEAWRNTLAEALAAAVESHFERFAPTTAQASP